jgi:hypothetical protein
MSVTENKNFLSPNGFKVTINASTFANIEYFCTEATLPAVNLAGAPLPFRGSQNAMPGDRLEFAPFDMRFQISENMENYMELFNWMRQNQASDSPIKSDVILSILSSKNNGTRQIRYIDAFPVSMGSLQLRTQNQDVDYLTMDCSFYYNYFEFLR